MSLGALFGLILTLPFGGYKAFTEFIREIAFPEKVSVSDQSIGTQALLLLLPFVLGFSTSLVIMILNKLIAGIQAFFGSGHETAASSPPATTTAPNQPTTAPNPHATAPNPPAPASS